MNEFFCLKSWIDFDIQHIVCIKNQLTNFHLQPIYLSHTCMYLFICYLSFYKTNFNVKVYTIWIKRICSTRQNILNLFKEIGCFLIFFWCYLYLYCHLLIHTKMSKSWQLIYVCQYFSIGVFILIKMYSKAFLSSFIFQFLHKKYWNHS